MAQRGAAGAVGARREFDLVIPGAVHRAPAVAAPQLRALAAERLAGALVTAAALLVRRSVAHRVLLGRGCGAGAPAGGGPGVPVESAGRGACTRGSPPPVKRGGRARRLAGRAGDGQAEKGEQPGGGDAPGAPGPDDRAGELPGAGQLVGPGAAEAQCPPGGDQVGDGGQLGDLGEGQRPRHHGRRPSPRPPAAGARAAGVPGGGRRRGPAAPSDEGRFSCRTAGPAGLPPGTGRSTLDSARRVKSAVPPAAQRSGLRLGGHRQAPPFSSRARVLRRAGRMRPRIWP